MAAQYIEAMMTGARPRLNLAGRPLAWPAPCPVCGQWSGERVCATCMLRFAPVVARCQRCALPLGSTVAGLCGHCVSHPPPFSHAVCGVDYQFPWDHLITAFKFNADLSLLPALSFTLLTALRQPGATAARCVDMVVPMPLSTARLRERGFNQSWELAHRTASALGLPARHDLLLRWRDTAHQLGLPRQERLTNLRHAFMTAPHARTALHQRHVALVDDVMTTGTSAAEASRTLLAAGASQVSLWLLARTPETA
jgi:ComF family protein